MKNRNCKGKKRMMVPNKVTLAVILVGLATLSACNWFGGSTEHGHGSSVVLINVLDKEFFDDCHIAGSVNVPLEQLEEYAKKNVDKDAHVIIYCANYKCLASAEGAKMLREIGFNNVWAFEGGTAEWKKMGYPVTGPCQQAYLADFERPQDLPAAENVPVISAEELKQKIDDASHKHCC